MFKKNTVSVWELGNFEDQAMLSGEEIPVIPYLPIICLPRIPYYQLHVYTL
jgi:hypothetical protein